jgi:hypothetical protein
VYLAACLKFGVPGGAEADRVRHDLMAARDADGPKNVPTNAIAMGLLVYRVDGPPAMPPLVSGTAQLPDGPLTGVLLVGQIFVAWDYERGPHLVPPSRRVTFRLVVGGKADGTVSEP